MDVIFLAIILYSIQFSYGKSATYSCSKDVGINLSHYQTILIDSLTTSSKFKCLGECNKNPYCFSLIYNEDSTTTATENCYFFNRRFFQHELIQSNKMITCSKPRSLLTTFKNATLKKTISSFGMTFKINCIAPVIFNKTIRYYVGDNTNNRILVFNEKWENLLNKSFNKVSDIIYGRSYIYLTSSNNGIYKVDMNLNTIKSISNSLAKYEGGYYNETDDTIFVSAYAYSQIEVFDVQLNKSYEIPLGVGISPMGVNAYGRELYVCTKADSTATRVVFKIINQQIVGRVTISTTTNTWTLSLVLDDYDYIAVSLNNPAKAVLYTRNSTNTGLAIVESVGVVHVGFDATEGLIIGSEASIKIYN